MIMMTFPMMMMVMTTTMMMTFPISSVMAWSLSLTSNSRMSALWQTWLAMIIFISSWKQTWWYLTSFNIFASLFWMSQRFKLQSWTGWTLISSKMHLLQNDPLWSVTQTSILNFSFHTGFRSLSITEVLAIRALPSRTSTKGSVTSWDSF